LELKRVQLSKISSLLQLTLAPQLRSLTLSKIEFTKPQMTYKGEFCQRTKAAVQQVADAIPGLLQQLPLLSVLKLPGIFLTDAAAQQLSAL
jgi:hypothetical protein